MGKLFVWAAAKQRERRAILLKNGRRGKHGGRASYLAFMSELSAAWRQGDRYVAKNNIIDDDYARQSGPSYADKICNDLWGISSEDSPVCPKVLHEEGCRRVAVLGLVWKLCSQHGMVFFEVCAFVTRVVFLIRGSRIATRLAACCIRVFASRPSKASLCFSLATLTCVLLFVRWPGARSSAFAGAMVGAMRVRGCLLWLTVMMRGVLYWCDAMRTRFSSWASMRTWNPLLCA